MSNTSDRQRSAAAFCSAVTPMHSLKLAATAAAAPPGAPRAKRTTSSLVRNLFAASTRAAAPRINKKKKTKSMRGVLLSALLDSRQPAATKMRFVVQRTDTGAPISVHRTESGAVGGYWKYVSASGFPCAIVACPAGKH